MVYVDELRPAPRAWLRTRWGKAAADYCHLAADTEAELHAFAARLGLRRAWYQGPPRTRWAHYDLTADRRAAAVAAGAVEITGRELLDVVRRTLRAAPPPVPTAADAQDGEG